MKTCLILLICFCHVALLLFSPAPVPAATATHTYDELNRLVQTVYDTGSKVTTIAYAYDAAGNMTSSTITVNFLLGDVDGNQVVDLADAVLCLQVAAGITSASSSIHQGADIDGDNRLGMVELIYILRKVAGLD